MTSRQISDAFWTPPARLLVALLLPALDFRDRHRTPVAGVHRPL
jgi:hypothetical protein